MRTANSTPLGDLTRDDCILCDRPANFCIGAPTNWRDRSPAWPCAPACAICAHGLHFLVGLVGDRATAWIGVLVSVARAADTVEPGPTELACTWVAVEARP